MANALEPYTEDAGTSGMVRDADGVFRVRIGGPEHTNKLEARMAPPNGAPADESSMSVDIQALIANIGSMISSLGTAGVEPGAPSNPTVDKLFGMNGKDRYQLWPEKMIRSGLALPGDVASGEQLLPIPGLRTEDVVELPNSGGWLGTSPWQQPADRVIERAQDTAGLMGGGAFAGTKPGQASLGSGPVRRLDNGFRPEHTDSTLSYLKSANRLNDDGTISVFHVAPTDSVGSIMKDGLIPGKSPASGQNWKAAYSGDGTYFHGTREAAMENLSQTDPGTHQIIEARIPATKTNFKKFLPDEDVSLDPMDGLHALAKGESTAVLGGVKPQYLKLLSDSAVPGAPLSAIAKQQAPAFYSAVEHSVRNAAQPKMTYDQWMGYLKNQPGVKGEELSWMGLGEKNPFEGKSVSKGQMQQWVDNHKVEIKEVNKQGGMHEDDAMNTASDAAEARVRELRPDLDPNSPNFHDLVNEYTTEIYDSIIGDTKFGSYQLPGGDNYREVLFTLPNKAKGPSPELLARKEASDARLDEVINALKDKYKPKRGEVLAELQDKMTPEDRQLYIDTNRERGAIMSEMAEATGSGTKGDAAAGNYRSSHWDEPNVLAHTRLNDRVIDGKKSLHVEEIQSDWHQEGRKKGYKDNNPESAQKAEQARFDYQAILPEIHKMIEDNNNFGHRDMPDAMRKMRDQGPDVAFPDATPEQKALAWKAYDAFNDANNMAKQVKTGVPDAPFKTTWPDLVLKRLIREASEKGYDQISWTPGEAQAARYDLSKSIDTLHAKKNADGSYILYGELPGTSGGNTGNGLHQFGDAIPADKLSDYVGKDVAQKILDSKTDKTELSGTDLKVGGEGMKAFYDKMLVDKANALGKKFGAKVNKTRLGVGEKGNPLIKDAEGNVTGGLEAYVLPITDKMREAAIGKGFALFTSGIPFPLVPVDNNPWEKQK